MKRIFKKSILAAALFAAAAIGADGTGYRYSYNDESRLSRVKDARGKTVEIYDYNLEYNGTE